MLRRDFFKLSIFAAYTLTSVNLNAKNLSTKVTQVAIVGGGFAGLSVAKRLKELNKNLDVTIIEPRTNFISCPMSNAYLGGLIPYEKLNYDYNSAVINYKYNFINELVVDINKKTKTIKTNKQSIKYDYLVMAVGIDYDYSELFKSNTKAIKECYFKAPPGLKPGSEHLKLKRLINDFKEGNFIIRVPNKAYKCPPAPYERACMIANYFKENKIDGKVIIIDSRAKPAAKSKAFLKAFKTYYKDYIEFKGESNFKAIDFKKKILTINKFDKKSLDYKEEKIAFEAANIIPTNIGNNILKKIGLKTNNQGFALLQEPTFRSITDNNIYVVGDAQGQYKFPKSGQMANSCGYRVAEELVLRFENKDFDYKNELPGNICYSMITRNKAVSISHNYNYKKENLKVNTYLSKIDKDTAKAAMHWYEGLIEDILSVKV